MDTQPTLAESLRFPRAAEAALDACAEAVLVFDPSGRLVYGNAPARRLLGRMAGDGALTRDGLLPQLEPLGARVVPLSSDGARLADAVYVPGSPTGDTLATRERRAIVETLETTGWRLSESARALGISRTTLWRRLRTYGLHRDGRLHRPSPGHR